ncbi:lysophospholipid acyltransferase family protein [Adhaeretor mobilis]|uniref:1-acyl-sn-glycerol-3-phosphate acyltransferase n=1 Tax=Adhaeretor mobilis TaxID=1930276 RepID=A0A517MY70_9BACT|nr:lysophospholipid acyltransferase family protein [Adhaeretor mobilis]QDS99835.1 1-acyl-sn-glycerol-3-phosphate acyltransferase [Adhaeretor mobilis]
MNNERRTTPGLWPRIRLGWRIAAFLTATVALYLGLRLDGLFRRRLSKIERINLWVPRWARTFLWLFGVHVEARGPHLDAKQLYPGCDSNGVGRIFVANHRSAIDIPVVLSLFAGHAISRHDLANWPLFGSLGKQVGTLYVDRSSRRSGAEVLGEVDASLKSGEGVVMFPEGTSHLGDDVHAFRPGAFKAAERAGAQLVPWAIAYEDDDAHYYHESFTNHLLRIGTRRRLHVAVVAAEPISPDGRTAIEVRDAVQEQVQAMVHEARSLIQPSYTKAVTQAKPLADVSL